jgi:hypothetical protein
MPVIPPTETRRRAPTAAPAVVTPDVSAPFRAQEKMAQSIQHLGDALQGVADRKRKARNRYELAKAKSEWVKTKSAAESALDEYSDADYGRMTEDYRGILSPRISEISEIISDEGERAVFSLGLEDDLNSSSVRIDAKSWDAEKRHHRGELSTSLASLRESALTGNSAEALAAMQEQVDAAMEMGYLAADEAETLRVKTAQDYAVSRVKITNPRAVPEMLKGDLGKLIPTDQKIALTAEARAAVVEEDAMLNVDMWMAQGLSIEEATTRASKIKDADVRTASEDRFKQQYAMKEKARVDASNNLFQDLWDQIDAGALSYDNITRGQKDSLLVVHQKQLRDFYRSRSLGDPMSDDLDLFSKVITHAREGRFEVAKQTLLDNRVSLKNSTSVALLRDIATMANQPFYRATGALDVMLDEAKIKNKDDQARAQLAFFQWRENYKAEHDGTEPGTRETQEFMKQLTEEPDKWIFFKGDSILQRMEEASKDRKEFDVVYEMFIQETPEKEIDTAREMFRKRYGRDPTERETMELHKRAKDGGLL